MLQGCSNFKIHLWSSKTDVVITKIMAGSYLPGVFLTTMHFLRRYLIAIDPCYLRRSRGVRDESNACPILPESSVDSRSSFLETGHRRVRNIATYIKSTREAR